MTGFYPCKHRPVPASPDTPRSARVFLADIVNTAVLACDNLAEHLEWMNSCYLFCSSSCPNNSMPRKRCKVPSAASGLPDPFESRTAAKACVATQKPIQNGTPASVRTAAPPCMRDAILAFSLVPNLVMVLLSEHVKPHDVVQDVPRPNNTKVTFCRRSEYTRIPQPCRYHHTLQTICVQDIRSWRMKGGLFDGGNRECLAFDAKSPGSNP